MVLSFVRQKGGTGETTLALRVANKLPWKEERVTVIDANSQGSAPDWALARVRSGREFDCVSEAL